MTAKTLFVLLLSAQLLGLAACGETSGSGDPDATADGAWRVRGHEARARSAGAGLLASSHQSASVVVVGGHCVRRVPVATSVTVAGSRGRGDGVLFT